MSSNRKPATKGEAPQEPFKRAVSSCLRSMAQNKDLEVSFAADRPSLIGSGAEAKARLPEPARKLSPREAAIVRGHADSMALRIACHDANVHKRNMPKGQEARAVFDAVEQARVESIGARRMEGVAGTIPEVRTDWLNHTN